MRFALESTPRLQNVWVAAEVSDLRGSGGHTYLVLLQKDEDGNITARLRATIWRSALPAILGSMPPDRPLRQVLANEQEVRVCGSVQYHPAFGASFNITAVDPLYGHDAEKRRQLILEQLRKEGLAERNRSAFLPWPPQRIAVISAYGAAGYGDFMDQLHNNRHGIVFYTKIYESVMQGTRTSESIRAALARIELTPDLFDCVVIIRGGGASSDLAGFDDLDLARAVAKFPLPVAVGIGHERDNTVLDLIAHTRLKTPTAVAEWLVGMSSQALDDAASAVHAITSFAIEMLNGEKRQVENIAALVPILSRNIASRQSSALQSLTGRLPLLVRNRLDAASASLHRASSAVTTAGQRRMASESQHLASMLAALKREPANIISREDERLSRTAQLVRVLSPEDTLRRGYSVTRIDGKAVRDAGKIPPGTRLETTLLHGKIISESIR